MFSDSLDGVAMGMGMGMGIGVGMGVGVVTTSAAEQAPYGHLQPGLFFPYLTSQDDGQLDLIAGGMGLQQDPSSAPSSSFVSSSSPVPGLVAPGGLFPHRGLRLATIPASPTTPLAPTSAPSAPAKPDRPRPLSVKTAPSLIRRARAGSNPYTRDGQPHGGPWSAGAALRSAVSSDDHHHRPELARPATAAATVFGAAFPDDDDQAFARKRSSSSASVSSIAPSQLGTPASSRASPTSSVGSAIVLVTPTSSSSDQNVHAFGRLAIDASAATTQAKGRPLPRLSLDLSRPASLDLGVSIEQDDDDGADDELAANSRGNTNSNSNGNGSSFLPLPIPAGPPLPPVVRVDFLERLAASVKKAATSSAADKAKQGFVNAWLHASYMASEEGNVSRQGLYNSYQRVCVEYDVKCVNSASFGKAVRLCFPRIKTRRLGVRGNSKYHYCGIRPKTSTEAEVLSSFTRAAQANLGYGGEEGGHSRQDSMITSDSEDEQDDDGGDYCDDGRIRLRAVASSPALRSPNSADATFASAMMNGNSGGGGVSGLAVPQATVIHLDPVTPTADSVYSNTPATPRYQHRSAHSVASTAPSRETKAVVSSAGSTTKLKLPPARLRRHTVSTVAARNRAGVASDDNSHSSASSSSPSANEAQQQQPESGSHRAGRHGGGGRGQDGFETVTVRALPGFPTSPGSAQLGGWDGLAYGGGDRLEADKELWAAYERHCQMLLNSVRASAFDQYELHIKTFWLKMTAAQRHVLHSSQTLMAKVLKADAVIYDTILEHLHSQSLSVMAPQVLTTLHQLAEGMESILASSLVDGFEQAFVSPKVELGARFGHLLLRYIGVYQLTQALRGVINDESQVGAMLDAWDTIDFEAIRNQAALTCNCQHGDLIQTVSLEFRQLLESRPGSVQPFFDFVDNNIWRRFLGDGSVETTKDLSPRSFQIRFSFITSQLMRDLTLRSIPCFGAFQIVKLFFDDLLGLKVLRTVALSIGSVSASVYHQDAVMANGDIQLDPFATQQLHALQYLPPAVNPTTAEDIFSLSSAAPFQTGFPASSVHDMGFSPADVGQDFRSYRSGSLSSQSTFGDLSLSSFDSLTDAAFDSLTGGVIGQGLSPPSAADQCDPNQSYSLLLAAGGSGSGSGDLYSGCLDTNGAPSSIAAVFDDDHHPSRSRPSLPRGNTARAGEAF